MTVAAKGLCESGAFDLTSACVRDTWSALVPTAYILLVCLASTPLPTTLKRVLRVIGRPFQNFLTLPEAEALLSDEPHSDDLPANTSAVPLWRTVLLSLVALAETLAWLVLGSYRFAVQPESLWEDLQPFIIAASWLYATCRPIASPTATPPYDLFAMYCLRLAFDLLAFGGVLYDHTVYEDPLPGAWAIAGHLLNLVALCVLLAVTFGMPLAVPSHYVKPEDIVRTASNLCEFLID